MIYIYIYYRKKNNNNVHQSKYIDSIYMMTNNADGKNQKNKYA